jgi:hypothetical protein
MEVAMGVVGGKLNPEIPTHCPNNFRALLESCFARDPKKRPTASFLASNIPKL